MSPNTTPSAERASMVSLPCGPCRVASPLAKTCCSLTVTIRPFRAPQLWPPIATAKQRSRRPYHRSAILARRGTSALDQPQLHRFDAWEYALDAPRIEAIHAVEKAREHGAIIGQDRVVAILEQGRLLDLDLLAMDASAIDAAAHHPIDAAMAVIRAMVAVLAESTAELRDHDHHRVVPGLRSDLLREAGERAAELAEPVGEIAVGCPLVDMGVPAADIDKAEIELFAHQAPDAPRRQLEAARRYCAAVGRIHLLRDRAVHIVANLEAFRNRGIEIALRVHLLDELGLAVIDAGLADVVDAGVGNLALAAEDQRQLIGEGDRFHPRKLGGQPAHEAGAIVACAAGRLAELDRILGFEMAARQVVAGAGERHEGDLAFLP